MAQQILNVGTGNNTGDGDALRVGMVKANDNFTELYEGSAALTNVVYINSPSDFPTAVSGVRELVVTPGVPITYKIAATNIDMGSDRFTITDGDVVIIGAHRSESTLTSTASGNFFTVVDSAFFPEFIGFDCVNATVIHFSTPVEVFKSIVLDNVIIRNCDKIAEVDGAFTTSLRTITIVATQTGGILWTGSDNNQINISNVLAISWAGILFDLGTATFNIVDISAGNRFISPAGTTIVSGSASSANLNTGGRGIVDSNLFNGLGTALSGIDTEDLQWTFHNNIFADNSTKNTEVVADAYLTTAETVTISTAGVFVAVGGSNWVTDITKRFTVSAAGVFTYIGLETIDVSASGVSSVEKVGGGADKICSKIAINGTVSDKTMGCTENTQPTGITSMGLFQIETGDTIQLFVANEDSTSNVIVDNSNIIITKRG